MVPQRTCGQCPHLHPAKLYVSDQTTAALRSVCDPLSLLTTVFLCFTLPAVFSMLLKLRYKLNSNPTLSAMLLKIKELTEYSNHSHTFS